MNIARDGAMRMALLAAAAIIGISLDWSARLATQAR